ncbi:cell division cycle- protein, partial [Coemansia sp. RSA 2703]
QIGSLPFFVRALYPFKSSETSGLTFERGEIIEVLACLESGWWNGICGNCRGWFPSNYVENISAEQVAILRQGQHLQHQQLPSTPTTPLEDLATTDQTLLTASANESHYRRGSIAVGDNPSPGVASAVPSRLRMGRRGSTPFNATVAEGSSDSQPRSRSGSADMTTSLVPVRGFSAGHINVENVHVAQWESRVTLDGRTYFCNIFTDRTTWSIAGDSTEGGAAANASTRALELIGEQATLVYVTLVLG